LIIKPSRAERLLRFFDDLIKDYRSLPGPYDPLLMVRSYQHPRDREIAAFIICMFDFGSTDESGLLLEKLLNRMGPKPGRFLVKANREAMAGVAEDLSLQFIDPQGVELFLVVLKLTLKKYRSLEELYNYVREGREQKRYLDILDRMISLMCRQVNSDEFQQTRIAHLFPRPAKGSPTARLHHFMRAVCRPDDGLDLGIWQYPSPAKLLIPLDATVARFASILKLSKSEDVSRTACLDLSRALSLLDADDPSRFSHAFKMLQKLDLDREGLLNKFRKA
jgi:uncharacterized protein (TIGR02757 family)